MWKLSKGGFAVSYTPFMLQGSVCVVEEYTALFLDQLGYNATLIGLAPILGVITQAFGLPLITFLADKYRARKLVLLLALVLGILVCSLFIIVPTPAGQACETTTSKIVNIDVNRTTDSLNTSSYSSDYSTSNITTFHIVSNVSVLNTTKIIPLRSAAPTKLTEHNAGYWLEYILIFIAIRGIFELLRRLCRTLITVATVSHVQDEKNKLGYYACWGYIGAGLSMLIIGILLENVKYLVCGFEVPNYAIIFVYAAFGHFLAILFLPWMNFQYLDDRIIDYAEIKQVLSRPHYILILTICCYGGMCIAYLSRWEFWYIKQLGGGTIAMTITGVIRRPVNAVIYVLSGNIIEKFGELNVLNVSLFIFFITFAMLALFPILWLVIVIDNIQSISYVLIYISCIIHFSKAASKASSAFFQGLVALLFTGVGQEVASAVFGVLFHSYGTTITFWCFALVSMVFCVMFTIYLFTVKDLDGYTKLRTTDDRGEN